MCSPGRRTDCGRAQGSEGRSQSSLCMEYGRTRLSARERRNGNYQQGGEMIADRARRMNRGKKRRKPFPLRAERRVKERETSCQPHARSSTAPNPERRLFRPGLHKLGPASQPANQPAKGKSLQRHGGTNLRHAMPLKDGTTECSNRVNVGPSVRPSGPLETHRRRKACHGQARAAGGADGVGKSALTASVGLRCRRSAGLPTTCLPAWQPYYYVWPSRLLSPSPKSIPEPNFLWNILYYQCSD